MNAERDRKAMEFLREMGAGSYLMRNGVNWRCEIPIGPGRAIFVAGEGHNPADAIICAMAKLRKVEGT